MNGFTSLEQRLQTAMCYAHLFGDALTLDELVRSTGSDAEQIQPVLRGWLQNGSVVESGGRWFLPGTEDAEFGTARERQAEAARLVLEQHRPLLRVLTALPWVRLLAVSGSTGRGGSARDSGDLPDLDLFLIVEPGSLHIVRLGLRLWSLAERLGVRLRAFGPRPVICPNYLTEASFQGITNRSYFTASDSLRVRVLKGESAYREFLAWNSWIHRYFPEPLGAAPPPEKERGPLLRETANVICFAALATFSWLKCKITGQRFLYSWSFRFDRNNCLRRAAIAGGGYQPQIAARFSEVHARYWDRDPELVDFLFPDTRPDGIVIDGQFAPAIAAELWPHE